MAGSNARQSSYRPHGAMPRRCGRVVTALAALGLAAAVASAEDAGRGGRYNSVANEPDEIAAAMPEGKAEFTVRQVAEVIAAARDATTPADLSNKTLKYLDLAGLDLRRVRLSDSDLWGIDLSEANLSGVDLSRARLNRASITRTDFSNANLEGATILRPTVHTSFQFEWKDAPRFPGANLKGLRVMGRLDGTDFRGADLSRSDFSAYEPRAGQGTLTTRAGVDLMGCDFSGARLVEANLTNAQLSFARFPGADLTRARLAHADLSKADLSGADLTGADLTGAELYGATLTGAKGLETVTGLAAALNLDKAVR